MRKVKTLTALAIMLLLTACSGVIKELSQDWKNAVNPPPPAPLPAAAVYCYSSLGQVSCYDKPQQGDKVGTFVGTTEQPPSAHENKILPGDIKLPIAPVVDENNAPVEPPSEQPTAITAEDAESGEGVVSPAIGVTSEPSPSENPPSVVRVDQPVIAPVSPPLPTAMPLPVSSDMDANKPLTDPYLRELNQQPPTSVGGDKPIVAPVAPIVEPKAVSKSKAKKRPSKKEH